MFHFTYLFVCQQDYPKATQLSLKFCRKVAHAPRKKTLDFGSNPVHIMLGLGLQLTFQVIPIGTLLRSVTGHVSEGSFVPNGVVQITKFDADPDP